MLSTKIVKPANSELTSVAPTSLSTPAAWPILSGASLANLSSWSVTFRSLLILRSRSFFWISSWRSCE